MIFLKTSAVRHDLVGERKRYAPVPNTPESVPDATGNSMTLPCAVNKVALDAAMRYGVAPVSGAADFNSRSSE